MLLLPILNELNLPPTKNYLDSYRLRFWHSGHNEFTATQSGRKLNLWKQCHEIAKKSSLGHTTFLPRHQKLPAAAFQVQYNSGKGANVVKVPQLCCRSRTRRRAIKAMTAIEYPTQAMAVSIRLFFSLSIKVNSCLDRAQGGHHSQK